MRIPLKTLLYVSELADDAPPSVVGAITKTARANNHARGIRGLLIFDGLRFAQMLEGPSAAIDDLLAKLKADRRHANLQVLSLHTAANADPATGHFAGWDLGYVWMEDGNEEAGIARLLQHTQPHAAEAAFLNLAATADRGGMPAAEVAPSERWLREHMESDGQFG